MRSLLWLMAVSVFALRVGEAATPVSHGILMTFWSDDSANHSGNALPGSRDASGALQKNPALLKQLDDLDVLAYAFLLVDEDGNVHFQKPAQDLSAADVQGFCGTQPTACPQTTGVFGGSFDAFAHLTNHHGTLKKIISIGGGGEPHSLDNAAAHSEAFVRSAVALIKAFGLDGIDLDLEPEAFFGPDQGAQLAGMVSALRSALGPQAFISIELPGDWESLRSFDCPNMTQCRYNLGAVSQEAYVSLMGYDFHGPEYSPVTGHHANLFSDPEDPLLAGFYHLSDQQAIEYLTFRHVASGRILLGFPAYFVAYGGVHGTAQSKGLYQPFDKAKTPPFGLYGTKGRGSYRIATALLKSGFTEHSVRVNGKLSAVYAYDPDTHQWLSYDNPDLVTAKARYVLARHLAGMMMWEMGEDLPPTDPRSLLRSAHQALTGAQEYGHR